MRDLRKTIAKLLFVIGAGACVLPLVERGAAWLIDREYARLRSAYGVIPYSVSGKRQDANAAYVEVRRALGTHGLPAWAVRVDPARWADVQAGDRWEGAAPAGETAPLFRSSDTGLGQAPFLPRLALGILLWVVGTVLRSKRWLRGPAVSR
jgi:hypothetical protein